MRSTPDTVRFVAIMAAMILLPSMAGAGWFVVLGSVFVAG